MSMGLRSRSSSSTPTPFALELIAALQDPDVADAFRKAQIVNYEDIADVVTAKLSVRLKKMQEENAAKDERIKELEEKVEELERKADDQEQYSRRTSVRIYGVPEKEGEDVLSLANELFNEMNINPTVNRIHRVGPPRNSNSNSQNSSGSGVNPPTKPNSPRPILCQFVAYPDKANVIKERNLLSKNFSRVFINEDLTRKRAKLLFHAREKKRAGVIKDCWSFDGRIAIKNNQNTIIPIRQLSDLAKIEQITTVKTS